MAEARRAEIAAAARQLLETEGPDALSMRRVAAAIGIQAASLYEHIANKAELEAAIIASGLEEWRAELGAAEPNIGAVAGAYRRFAVEHPHLYELMTDHPLPRELLPEGLEANAAAPLVELFADRDTARAAWAAAHGLISLELAGRFPADADLDAAWAAMVRAFAEPACIPA